MSALRAAVDLLANRELFEPRVIVFANKTAGDLIGRFAAIRAAKRRNRRTETRAPATILQFATKSSHIASPVPLTKFPWTSRHSQCGGGSQKLHAEFARGAEPLL